MTPVEAMIEEWAEKWPSVQGASLGAKIDLARRIEAMVKANKQEESHE